jgi:2-C-methyl-D-erythritol 4-phosphate cytidylyltransferase
LPGFLERNTIVTEIKKSQRHVRVIALVPAAGIGRRFGSGTNKPFHDLNGKPLILWSLEVLESVDAVIEIIPILQVADMDTGRTIFEQSGFLKIKKIAPGGKERQDSVYNGLKLIQDKNCMVLIHDCARPLIEKSLVVHIIRHMSEIVTKQEHYDGIIPGVPLKDTIKESDGTMTVKKTLKRNALWAIQTPQVFPYENIMRAYTKAMKARVYATDDAALIEHYKGRMKIMMGSYTNIKITTPEDLALAEFFLSRKA